MSAEHEILELIYHRVPPDGWQRGEVFTARRLIDRGASPARVAAVMDAIEAAPFWRGKVRSASDLERHWTTLEIELNRSKDGKLEDRPWTPDCKPYSGPTDYDPRDSGTWACEVHMTSEQRDELNARVQAMEEKKRELRARGVPWVEVCRQVGGLDVRELVKRAGSEKPRKQVRDC